MMYSYDELQKYNDLVYEAINQGYGKDVGKITKGKWDITVKAINDKGETVELTHTIPTKNFKNSELASAIMMYYMIGKDLREHDIFMEIFGDLWVPYNEDYDPAVSYTEVKVKGPDGDFDIGAIDYETAKLISYIDLVHMCVEEDYVVLDIMKSAFGEEKKR